MKISVIGAGSWGTALSQVLGDNHHEVLMYSREEEVADEINRFHTNKIYFDNALLNENVKATTSLMETVEFADILLISVPVKAYRDVLNNINRFIKNKKTIISTAKGFEEKTNYRMSEVIKDAIDKEKLEAVVSLIGPSHAEEVILRELTCICAVSNNKKVSLLVQKIFSNNYFRVYLQNDEIGAETAAALKNAIAIASGVLQGVGLGDNARAALVTRGLVELIRFGTYQGGKFETFMGLTGIGDLLVTCNSWHSRNFQAGYQIGKDNSAREFLKNNKMTVEGIQTVKIVHQIAIENQISMPIIEALYRVLFENFSPREMIDQLMNRELKEE